MHKSEKDYLKTGPKTQVKRKTYNSGLVTHHLHRCIFSTNYGFTILDPLNFGDSLW